MAALPPHLAEGIRLTTIVTVRLVLLVASIVPCLYRVAVFAIIQGSWAYIEISMGLSVLAFVGTLAIAHYVERGRIF